VYVNGSGGAYAVSNKRRPFNGIGLFTHVHELGYGVRMEKAEIGCFDLPRLVLTIPSQLVQVYRKKGSIDNTMNEVIYEFAED
jgi:hypothetical protein